MENFGIAGIGTVDQNKELFFAKEALAAVKKSSTITKSGGAFGRQSYRNPKERQRKKHFRLLRCLCAFAMLAKLFFEVLLNYFLMWR